MRKFITVTIFVCFNILLLLLILLITTPSFSRNLAGSEADEDIYRKIDSLVAATPNVRLDFESVPETGTTVINITTDSTRFLQDLVEKGIMEYCSMLDGDVKVVIEYFEDTSAAVMTIIQIEQERV